MTRLALLLCTLLALAAPARAQTEPWKVAYLEASDSWTHRLVFQAFRRALAERGYGGRIAFAPDAMLSAGNRLDTASLRAGARTLMARGDIALIVAMGTTATEALLEENNGRTPVLGLNVADAVDARLDTAATHAAADNIAVLDLSFRWTSLVRQFHAIAAFHKLGTVLADPENGPISKQLREIARDGGFQLEISREVNGAGVEACRAAIRALIPRGIDAFVIPPIACFDPDRPEAAVLIEELTARGIATLVPEGGTLVKQGALIGLSRFSPEQVGARAAELAVRILEGASPASLDGTFDRPPSIAINLGTARRLRSLLPLGVLVTADQLYLTPGGPAGR